MLCKMAELRLVQMPVSEHGRKEGVTKHGAPDRLSGMPDKQSFDGEYFFQHNFFEHLKGIRWKKSGKMQLG